METTRTIKGHYQDIQFGYWDAENEEFVPIESASPEFAAKLGCSELLLDTLVILVQDIKEKFGEDLKDIWRKVG